VNKRPNVQTGLNDLQGVYWLYKMQVIVRESVFHVYFVIFCVVANPNCSFPYTYNGGLYYGCINDMTGVSTADQPFACMAVNATPSVCDSPGVHSAYLNKLITVCAVDGKGDECFQLEMPFFRVFQLRNPWTTGAALPPQSDSTGRWKTHVADIRRDWLTNQNTDWCFVVIGLRR